MSISKTIEKRVKVKTASYPTFAVFLTPYGKALAEFNKRQGTQLENQAEYFDFLAETFKLPIVTIKKLSFECSPSGDGDFNSLVRRLQEMHTHWVNLPRVKK